MKKKLYRFVKVIGIIPIIWAISGFCYEILLFFVKIGNERMEKIMLIYFITIILLIEFIKRAIYYIFLGKIFPPKD